MDNSFLEKERGGKSRDVIERDIARYSGYLAGGVGDVSAKAKHQILNWVEKHWGVRLSEQARQSGDLNDEVPNIYSISYGNIWALRTEKEDKGNSKRVWKNEIYIVGSNDRKAVFGARMILQSKADDENFPLISPGYIDNIAISKDIHLRNMQSKEKYWSRHIPVRDMNPFHDFIGALFNPERIEPIVVLTKDSDSKYLLDPDKLAREVAGLGHIYCLSDDFSDRFSREIGNQRGVIGGGVRLYPPGLERGFDPHKSRLFVRKSLHDISKSERSGFLTRHIHSWMAGLSTKHNQLGDQVLRFYDLKGEIYQKQTEDRVAEIEKQQDQSEEHITSLHERIAFLEEQLETNKEHHSGLKNDIEQALKWSADYEERANHAESRTHKLEDEVKKLKYELRKNNISLDHLYKPEPPTSMDQLEEWIESCYDNVVLMPSASRGIKKAKYEDVGKIVKAIDWLADYYGKPKDAVEEPREKKISDGIKATPCGSDTYEFSWEGRSYSANWHIKHGTSREERHCLRIYYAWDSQQNKVLISDMPSHIRNRAS